MDHIARQPEGLALAIDMVDKQSHMQTQAQAALNGTLAADFSAPPDARFDSISTSLDQSGRPAPQKYVAYSLPMCGIEDDVRL